MNLYFTHGSVGVRHTVVGMDPGLAVNNHSSRLSCELLECLCLLDGSIYRRLSS